MDFGIPILISFILLCLTFISFYQKSVSIKKVEDELKEARKEIQGNLLAISAITENIKEIKRDIERLIFLK